MPTHHRATRARNPRRSSTTKSAKTTKTEVIEGGRVNRISVAVLVDGTYAKNDKGDFTYQPRSKEEIDQIASLVRTAIGFDQKRGDQVEVVNLRFAETPATPITEPSGWLAALVIHQGRHHAGHRNGGHGSIGLCRAAHGRAGRWCAASWLPKTRALVALPGRGMLGGDAARLKKWPKPPANDDTAEPGPPR